jgi:hypothetical protein
MEELMAKMTPKENYLAYAYGKLPEWIPGGMPYKDHGMATGMAGPLTMWVGQSDLKPGWSQPLGYWKDFWGANYMWREGDMAGIPDPNNFALKDILKWHDVVKKPQVPDLDWESMAKTELDRIDRKTTALSIAIGFQPFQQTVALLGFNETLCAMYEEPEAVKELLNYMADWYVPIIEKIVKYYDPDLCAIADDTAAKNHPFFSPDMYADIFKPIYAKITRPITEQGKPIDFHNCGKCEGYIGHMIDYGVRYWNPAQLENDLQGITKKYGRKIAHTGGWDPDKISIDAKEEDVRQAVRDYIDTYAKDGAMLYSAYAGDFSLFMTPPDQLTEEQKIARDKWGVIGQWMSDENYNYGTGYYDR